MKVYLISAQEGFPQYRQALLAAEARLAELGHSVMNPAWLWSYPAFSREDYLAVCKAMMSRCDAALLLAGWANSWDSRRERGWAARRKMPILSEEEGAWDELAREAPRGGKTLEEAEELRRYIADLCAGCRRRKECGKNGRD